MKSTIIKSALFCSMFLACSQSAMADQVIQDDLIVDGNLCVGQDCNNGEDFAFGTIRFQENNLRLHFEDTSSSASFPSNDWRILINGTGNGSENHFSVEDSTADSVPFVIEAGANSNTLVVDAEGKVGVGTNTPSATFHVEGNGFISGNLELGSSRSLKGNIRALETDEAVATLRALRPVKYHYKNQPDEETLGFIAEDVPDLVATNSRKSLMPADIIAVLTKVIQKQDLMIEKLSQRLDALEK